MLATSLTNLDTPQEWNLSDLYQGFDDPRLNSDLEALQKEAAEFREQYRGRVANLTPEQIAECLQHLEAIAE